MVGAGNDTLLGNRGNDIVLGQNGNDLLIVNNGDGSDFNEPFDGFAVIGVDGLVSDPNPNELGFDFNHLVIRGGGGSADVLPTEELSLNYAEIEFEYSPAAPFELTFGIDDGMKTVEYCVYEQVQEAGVYELVCYEIEIPEECELVSPEAGVYKIECPEDEGSGIGVNLPSNVKAINEGNDGMKTVEYCVYEQVSEAGVYELVCYEIEIPEECELISPEAGVYKIECPEELGIVSPMTTALINTAATVNDITVDDGMKTVEYCVYEQASEAGVYELVCYEIEIPEECELVSPESGVYKVECPEEESGINFNLPSNVKAINEGDDGMKTVEYCVYEQVQEAGVYELVCYEIEIPEECELVSPEAGVYKIECPKEIDTIGFAMASDLVDTTPSFNVMAQDDGMKTVEYCVYEQVQEAGVYELVCYEIEIPENCELVSPEAGVYKIECEDEATIKVNPLLDTLPGLDLTLGSGDDPVLVGLLLPAVQAAREAAR